MWVAWSNTETECEWTRKIPEGKSRLRRDDVGGNSISATKIYIPIPHQLRHPGTRDTPLWSYCTLHRWANTIVRVTKEQKSSWVSSVSEQRLKYDLIVVMFPSASVSWARHMTSAALQCQAPNCTAHNLSLNEPLPPWTGQWNLCPHGRSKLALFIQNISEGFYQFSLKVALQLIWKNRCCWLTCFEILNFKHNCITAKIKTQFVFKCKKMPIFN